MMRSIFLLLFFVLGQHLKAQNTVQADVLVIGGGTGGTAAAIQSARSGASTIVVEPMPWLGGMISAAGVSAIDGNHRLPSGLWAEFRNGIYQVYGGPAAVATGWVSNTQFEPHVADSLFKSMAAREDKLKVYHGYRFFSLQKKGDRITAVRFRNLQTGDWLNIQARVFIDATELGDVMKAAGVPYDLGMEADSQTGEGVGVTQTNDIVQDLTYVATLKDYGPGADRTIPKPAGYTPAEFDGACTDYYMDKSRKAPTVDAQKMLDYGKLPNGKYMINWPNYGNDTYLNVVELSHEQREAALEKAKQTTLRFVYFIQQQLGFRHLGLAEGEFPTADHLALMPYHREGRRLKGLVRMNIQHISQPFAQKEALYRTGISVGDYPIDHHHKKNPAAPQHLDFYPVPSFNVPLGALIPQNITNLVVAEKGISVSNVVNGTTRLQPCVLLTGQAAGTLAALSARRQCAVRQVPVRDVQQALLTAKAYLMPYIDVTPDNPHWEAVQKIGATGLLRGTGLPYKWANQTWFYPDSLVQAIEFRAGLRQFHSQAFKLPDGPLTIESAIGAARQLDTARFNNLAAGQYNDPRQVIAAHWKKWGLDNYDPGRYITRLELAVLLQNSIDPFTLKAVNHKGELLVPKGRK